MVQPALINNIIVQYYLCCRCSDLEDAVIAEKRRNEDMNVALKREQDMIARLRKNLEEERESSKEARQNDRATIGELRKILGL